MKKLLPDWLHNINLEMSKGGVHYAQRPLEALRRLSEQQKISVSIPSPLADAIFKWFEEHSPTGAHAVGSLFTSVLYFDTYFWKLEVPLAYGTVQLNALDCLPQMPSSIKEQLQNDRIIMWQFICLWIDSMDYAYGIDDLEYGKRLPQQGSHEFAAELTASAHHNLNACAQLLTEYPAPNVKAIESAALATEMFLKAYLAIHFGLSPEDAQKKFGHKLEKLASACQLGYGTAEFVDLAQYLSVFPPFGTRYKGTQYPPEKLWSGYAVALRTGVTFTRSLTERDNRAQFFNKQP